MKHLKATTLAIAALAAALPAAAAANTITYTADATLHGTLTPTGVNCLTPYGCELYFSGHGTWTGDFTGTDTFTAVAHKQWNGTLVWSARNAVLDGTINHCGTGTGLVNVDGTINGAQFPPLGATGTSSWNMVPGSGTGQLTSLISASGTETDFFGADGSITDHATGTVTCKTS